MFWGQTKSQELFPDIMLHATRIFMRPPHEQDWQQWANVRAENKRRIQPFEPTWSAHYQSEDFFQRRLARQAREWDLDKANAFLVFKNDGTLIGGMNINNISRGAAQFASLGYWIDQSYEGQSYMAEALQLTLKYCFEDLGLHRVHASCLPQNTRSKKTLLRSGFKQEGFAEKYLQIDGKWQDHELFGLSFERWKALGTANIAG